NKIIVTFDQPVTYNDTSHPEYAYHLYQISPFSDTVSFTVDVGTLPSTYAELTITGYANPSNKLESYSLKDGHLQLEIDNTECTSLQSYFTDYTSAYRLFGDVDGDQHVTGIDFLFFRLALLQNVPRFDWDGSGLVNGTDFTQFLLRF